MIEQLAELIETMDVPEFRRDVAKPENVRWLARNLAIQNREHPDLLAAREIIRKLLRANGEPEMVVRACNMSQRVEFWPGFKGPSER